MDPRKTAEILQETYGDNALSVALRWARRSRSAAGFWNLVAEDIRRRTEADGRQVLAGGQDAQVA